MTQATERNLYRDGDCLVVTEGAELPARCPVCNEADVTEPLEVRFAVQRKGGVIGKTVSAGIDAARGWNYTGPVVVRVPFCKRHRARRTYALAAGLALAAIGAVATFAVIRAKTTGGINVLAFAPLVIGLIVTFATISGVLNLWFKPRRFDDRTVWIAGVAPAYLDAIDPRGAE
jgi:hypothetical protein